MGWVSREWEMGSDLEPASQGSEARLREGLAAVSPCTVFVPFLETSCNTRSERIKNEPL